MEMGSDEVLSHPVTLQENGDSANSQASLHELILVLVKRGVPPRGDVREPAQRGQLGTFDVLNHYLHHEH